MAAPNYVSNRPPTPQPHRSALWTRLFGLYGRITRPITAEDEPEEGSPGSSSSDYEQLFRLSQDRAQRLRVFDEMDHFGLVSSILSCYAEETTQPDYDRGRSVWIEAKDAGMVKAGMVCLQNCQIEDKVGPIARRIVKYGDAFQRLLYASGSGVVGWRHASAEMVSRFEDKYGRLVGFKEQQKRFRGGTRETSWPWDYIHFRMLGKDEHTGYGTGLLEEMFRPWRQMTLATDSILQYRIRRTPDRNLVMVNVGNMEDSEAMNYVNTWRKRFKKAELLDPASGNYRKQYNPLTPAEDIFIPFREGQEPSRVETLAGGGNLGELYDLEHFRDEFFGAARAPKAYFGFEGDINAKATLAQQDVRFARTCKRVQKSIRYGLRGLLEVHYTLIDDSTGTYDFRKEGKEFLVQMSPIAYLDEFERLELVRLRFQLVTEMGNLAGGLGIDPRAWSAYLLLTYAKLPEDFVLRLLSKEPPMRPVQGAGPGFDALSQEQKEAILDPKGKSRAGYYTLNEAEQKQMAQCVHGSPRLRKIIGAFAELALEDQVELQRDRPNALVDPVRLSGTKPFVVDYTGDDLARELHEDMEKLRNGTLLREGGAATRAEGEPLTEDHLEEAFGAKGSPSRNAYELLVGSVRASGNGETLLETVAAIPVDEPASA